MALLAPPPWPWAQVVAVYEGLLESGGPAAQAAVLAAWGRLAAAAAPLAAVSPTAAAQCEACLAAVSALAGKLAAAGAAAGSAAAAAGPAAGTAGGGGGEAQRALAGQLLGVLAAVAATELRLPRLQVGGLGPWPDPQPPGCMRRLCRATCLQPPFLHSSCATLSTSLYPPP
jgi:hypothetical protein